MKTIPAFVVDAFTRRRFAGNPAAVCLLPDARELHWMQAVAAEFNLSETAFLIQEENDCWQLRWFTPTCEVDLCGHATLAATHVLANEMMVPRALYRFRTRSGELRAQNLDDGFQLDFPRIFTAPLELAPAILLPGAKGCYSAGSDLLVEFGSEAHIREFIPDLEAIRHQVQRGLIITAPGSDCDLVSRFFAPACGINEDPVTGSAHCALADFWHRKTGKTEFTARQLSARGGELNMILAGERVLLQGQAVTSLRATLAD